MRTVGIDPDLGLLDEIVLPAIVEKQRGKLLVGELRDDLGPTGETDALLGRNVGRELPEDDPRPRFRGLEVLDGRFDLQIARIRRTEDLRKSGNESVIAEPEDTDADEDGRGNGDVA